MMPDDRVRWMRENGVIIAKWSSSGVLLECHIGPLPAKDVRDPIEFRALTPEERTQRLREKLDARMSHAVPVPANPDVSDEEEDG